MTRFPGGHKLSALRQQISFFPSLESTLRLRGVHIVCAINANNLCQGTSLEKWTLGCHTFYKSHPHIFQHKLESAINLSLSICLFGHNYGHKEVARKSTTVHISGMADFSVHTCMQVNRQVG